MPPTDKQRTSCCAVNALTGEVESWPACQIDPALPLVHSAPSAELAPPPPTTVCRMRPADAHAIAHLHREGIPTGVLAELGPAVLSRVYRELNQSHDACVFVGLNEHEHVLGFVAGVLDVTQTYRHILHRHWLAFTLAGLRHVFSLRMLRRILNTLRYPSKVAGDYPRPELLSIVVTPAARGSGLATALLDALRAEFRARGVTRFKVMVRADFERANAYYRKHGFVLAGEISTHGHPANIYVLDTEAT